jgi:hypothetical protein
MTIHDELLVHAEDLARSDSNRPRQVNLRRSISAAYYALFHLLVWEASSLYVRGEAIAARLNRSYQHSEIKNASKSVSQGRFPKSLGAICPANSPPPDLKIVADAFVYFQEARHQADYDLSRALRRREAVDAVRQAQNAFEAWKRIWASDEAKLYLGSFLLWKEWDKERT